MEPEEFAQRVKDLAVRVEAMYPTAPLQEVIPAFRPRVLKLQIGALLRGNVRIALARDTNLEVKEVKGFLESIFILTANTPAQARELVRVQRWIASFED